MISKRRENMRWDPVISSGFLPKGNFWVTSQEGRIQAAHSGFAMLIRESLEYGEAFVAKYVQHMFLFPKGWNYSEKELCKSHTYTQYWILCTGAQG